ncbi:MAG: acylphosphatase [Chitinophagaceae bacterium]
MQQTISIIVTGKVQGVFYRQSTKEKADQWGITGTVQNMPDGSVYIIATATKELLEKLLSWCRQGPPKAIVNSVKNNELPLEIFNSFHVLRGR